LRIYLDNCSFNRPFDDQTQLKIKIETQAKLYIQSKILNGDLELVWSYILEFENSENPFLERKETIIIPKLSDSDEFRAGKGPKIVAG
jgi:hypothetical protein